MNVADLMGQQAAATPQATAVVDGSLELDYATFDRWIWGLAGWAHAAGLKRGEVVGLRLADPLLHLGLLLALARSGLTSVAVATDGVDTRESNALLARCGASAVIDDDEAGLDWGGLRRLRVNRAEMLALRTVDADIQLRDPAPAAPMLLKTSSGTTGQPKIVPNTHAGMVASIRREQAAIGYPPGDRYMTPVALRMDGPRRRYLACLASGATAVMPPAQRHAAAYLEAIERQRITHFSCVAGQASEMARRVDEAASTSDDAARVLPRFPFVRCFRLSAGPSEAVLHRRLRETITPNVWVSYGCTELGPLTVADPLLLQQEAQSVGRPMPGILVEIVGDDRQPLPAGQSGRIRLRAEGMPEGYHDDPDATARHFRDGWFEPGDMGRVDAEGRVFHLGRSDDLMVMDGVNIYPAEIEQVMAAHPAVADVLAMSVKHPVLNDVPVCAVALRDGAATSALQLEAYARIRLGARGPRRVVVLREIARTPEGKPRRARVAEQMVRLIESDGDVENEPRPAPLAPATGPAPLAQLAHVGRLTVPEPSSAERRRLALWLREVLVPDTTASRPTAEEAAVGRDSETASDMLAWIHDLLQLWRALLQAAQVPVFDRPRVIAIVRTQKPASDGAPTWEATIRLPDAEFLDNAASVKALRATVALGRWLARTPLDETQLQVLCARAQREVFDDLLPYVRGRKSTMPVLREAFRRSIPFLHLHVGLFQLGWGCHARRLHGSVTTGDSMLGAGLSANKAQSAALLRVAGLPAPDHQLCSDLEAARRVAAALGWPVVVKPVDRERGEGVTVDIADDAALVRAFEAARQTSTQGVLVERQIPGVCHRLFIAQGRLLYAVKRGPMSVQGDGVCDIATLVAVQVARERLRPTWSREPVQPLDALALQTLAAAGLGPGSVLAAGQRAALRPIESTAWGGVDEEVTSRIHPDNLAAALSAVRLFALEVAGVDIISPDIGESWTRNGARINEVNYAPLLGGAPISRSHIPAFLERLVGGDGTLPVELFVGGPVARDAALARWRAWRETGLQVFFSGTTATLDPAGQPVPLRARGLHGRTRALLLEPRVQALVLLMQTDEWSSTGWPLQAVSAVHLHDVDALVAWRPPHAVLTAERRDQLIDNLARLPRLRAHAPAVPEEATG